MSPPTPARAHTADPSPAPLATLQRAWGRVPWRLRRRLYPGLRGAYARLREIEELRTGGRLACTQLAGPSVTPGDLDVTLTVFGLPWEIEDAARRWFRGAPARTPQPGCSLATVSQRARGALAMADLVVVNLPRLARPLLGGSFTALPQSVEVVIRVARAHDLIARRAEPIRRYLALIERQGLRVEILQDRASLRHFYDGYYRPYQRTRFGPGAPERTLRFYERFAGRWEVLAILDQGTWIGAGTAIRHEDRYRFLDVGYLDGDESLLKRGVGHALYRAAINRAGQLGYDELDLGPERPFLADSVLAYKRKWGAGLRANPWASRLMALGYAELNASLRGLLRAVPLIQEGRDGSLYRLTTRPDQEAAHPAPRGDEVIGVRGTRFIVDPVRTKRRQKE